MQVRYVKKKDKVTEYIHSKGEDVFIWFADEESLEKAKEILNRAGDKYYVHSNEIDHGIEFKGPKSRAGYAVMLAKNPEIKIVSEPELGPYTPSRRPPKNRMADHPDFDKSHKDAVDSRKGEKTKDISVATPPDPLMMGEKTLGGDKSKKFQKDIDSDKERWRKNKPPFAQTKRAKEIGKSKDAIKGRDYQF